MSLEWSRIEPEEGTFSASAFEQYREELAKLKGAGIEPLATLHHFSNPLWLEDSGGWTDDRIVGRFERYIEEVVRRLGDLVSRWATINEPNVYLHGGYLGGFRPPGKQSLLLFFKGAVNMIGAHIAAYRTIHAVSSALGYDRVKVGPVHHVRLFDPLKDRVGERPACGTLRSRISGGNSTPKASRGSAGIITNVSQNRYISRKTGPAMPPMLSGPDISTITFGR